ncbi:cytochrome c biogenesis heme-transporting ATPase CcmA [Gynuella sp.]|uniref:cytochrome c biogenesis heme-transporting ATPase CcmA n=1 Tax=Gynuella sp. TaxID=2969146 RepID=UPI003D0AEBF0
MFKNLVVTLTSHQVMQVKGANGSGKTTLLRKLVGLSDVVEGDVEWYEPVGSKQELDAGKFLYLGHRPGVTNVSTALENLRFSVSLKAHLSLPEARYLAALDKVGLKGFEDVPAHSLSAGQQRRIALARLYLLDEAVPLWVLDEPFTALDLDGVAKLEQHIASHSERGGSVILTTHHRLDMEHLSVLDLEQYR